MLENSGFFSLITGRNNTDLSICGICSDTIGKGHIGNVGFCHSFVRQLTSAGFVIGLRTQKRSYPANNFSFVQISNPNVLLWTLKPAEDGISRGIVARVWNQGNSPTNYLLSLSQPITSAERLTYIETAIAPATVSNGQLNANINQQQIQTHLLKFTGSP